VQRRASRRTVWLAGSVPQAISAHSWAKRPGDSGSVQLARAASGGGFSCPASCVDARVENSSPMIDTSMVNRLDPALPGK
jgi:hypothetical protein